MFYNSEKNGDRLNKFMTFLRDHKWKKLITFFQPDALLLKIYFREWAIVGANNLICK